MAKKVQAKDLIKKIERITKQRMAKESVVSLSEFKKLNISKVMRTILLIEDDETMRKAIQRIFVEEGLNVIAAADGAELSDLLDDQFIDLILLDVGLPWINGFELAQLMKEHKDLKNIPLIFVSGRDLKEDIKRGFELGADDYIKKPFEIDQIKSAVFTLLEINS